MILKMNSYTETFGLSILVGYVAIFTIYVIEIIDTDRHAMTNKVVFHYFYLQIHPACLMAFNKQYVTEPLKFVE